MNTADFTTQSNGFPLESDATLGFMQSAYVDSIRALAKSLGLGNAIVTGLQISNGIAADGWILYNDDFIFFEGGTVANTFIIQTDVVAKQNQNGQLVDRYFSKKAKFGSGVGAVNFAILTRLPSLRSLPDALNSVANQGERALGRWVVLWGCKPTPAGGVDSGLAMYGERIISVHAYASSIVDANNPVYLTRDGEWTQISQSEHLQFNPYTDRRIEDLSRRAQYKSGEILWIDTTELDVNQFVQGVGRYSYEGFRIANGTGGTVDLSAAIAGLTAIQRI